MPESPIESFPRRHAATRRFTLGAPRSFTVSDDGERVAFLRSAGGTDPATSLWLLGRGDARPTCLFDAGGRAEGELTDAERARRERLREQASGVVSYSATPDLAHIVFALGGALHRVATASGDVTEVAAADEVFDPRPEVDGRRIAYVSGRGLRITDGVTDAPIPGTLEPIETVSWGSAEFVAAEEMGRTRGFWWDPAGGRLIATRVDVAPVSEWWISSPEDPARPPRPVRYPAAGTANAGVELWVVDPVNGPLRRIDWANGAFEYLAAVDWGERLLCTVQTRDQRRMAILDVDADTGATDVISERRDDHWVEAVPGSPTELDGQIVTVIDEGAARRLVVDGRSITGDDLQVRRLLGTAGGELVVVAARDPRSAVIARISTGGELTTVSDAEGYAAAVTAGGTICVTQARPDAATTHDIRWHDGTTTALESLADEPGFPCTPTFHVVGERRLHLALCLPHDHDGSPLPVLLDPYGGPHAQRVVFARNAFATSQWFAEQGFAVVVVDGRGTPGRGPAFEGGVSGDLAGPVLEDQIDALHALAERRSELDLGRVGIRGWSFGGYLAALAVLRRPDVFHAAVAGAPVTDWRLYDTHYTERYLGHPELHPDHYAATDLVAQADRLERPLLLIHGLADDNVVAAHTLTLSRALLEAGRPHQVLPLSGVTHMTPQEQVAENLLRLQLGFLQESLSRPGQRGRGSSAPRSA